MKNFDRRRFLRISGIIFSASAVSPIALSGCGVVGGALKLTLPYMPPHWDPTVGKASLDPGFQSYYRAVFDPFIAQNPDLTFFPGILTNWGWRDNYTKIFMEVRDDAFWHDGAPIVPEDVVWSIERASGPESQNPVRFIWNKVTNFRVSGYDIEADVIEFDPTFFKWMGFLTGFVMPKHAYLNVGAEAWRDKPIGSGPYMIDKFKSDKYVRLKAFNKYWGGKPAFENVEINFASTVEDRVAKLEGNDTDLITDIPTEHFIRLTKKGFVGQSYPVSDIGLIFLSNKGPMSDKNIRLAMHFAIDKRKIVDKLFSDFARPIDTLQVPEYVAYEPTSRFGYDPDLARKYLSRSGFSAQNPVKFTIQTTDGHKPKDLETVTEIIEMWESVGIEADIEIIDSARYLDLRSRNELAPACFYNWHNAMADPATSTGFAMYSQSQSSTFKSSELDKLIDPLWSETDEGKRISGFKDVDRFILEEGLVIPVLQYFKSVVHRPGIQFISYASGVILPQKIT